MKKLTRVVSSFMGKKAAANKKAAAAEPAAAEPQGVAWAEELVFNTDGSGDGAICNHPDTDGNVRNFETKIDNNQGNEPPTDPSVTEDDNWALVAEEEQEESSEDSTEENASAQISSLNARIAKLEADGKKSATIIASLKRQLAEANAKLEKTPAASTTTVTASHDRGHEYGAKKPVHSWEKKAARKVGFKTEE